MDKFEMMLNKYEFIRKAMKHYQKCPDKLRRYAPTKGNQEREKEREKREKEREKRENDRKKRERREKKEKKKE